MYLQIDITGYSSIHPRWRILKAKSNGYSHLTHVPKMAVDLTPQSRPSGCIEHGQYRLLDLSFTSLPNLHLLTSSFSHRCSLSHCRTLYTPIFIPPTHLPTSFFDLFLSLLATQDEYLASLHYSHKGLVLRHWW